MTVKELRNILKNLDDNTEIEICVFTETGEHIVLADELIIGSEPNRACLYGEE